jgi:hypothetical protein
MIYKRYLKKSETPDDDEAVSEGPKPSEVQQEDDELNLAEEAEDQDPESKHFAHTKPTSSQGILAQKLHDYIGSKLPKGISPQEHEAAIKTILSTQVKDPVSGQIKHRYINKDMRELFEQHPREPTRGVPQNRAESLSDKPLTYTPTEMIGPTASLAIMRMRIPDTEIDEARLQHLRASEKEDVQPEARTEDPDDEFDFSRSLRKDTQILDTMVKSLLRKIANGEI